MHHSVQCSPGKEPFYLQERRSDIKVIYLMYAKIFRNKKSRFFHKDRDEKIQDVAEVKCQVYLPLHFSFYGLGRHLGKCSYVISLLEGVFPSRAYYCISLFFLSPGPS